jgi:signal transduction histidine kinase
MARRWPRRVVFRSLRPKLRVRIIAAFGLGAFVLSASIATTAYLSARSTIVGQAVSTAETSAQSSESLLLSRLQSPADVKVSDLEQIDNAGGVVRSASVLYPAATSPGTQIVDDLGNLTRQNPPVELTFASLPSSLKRLTFANHPAEQIFAVGGTSFIGIGLPIPAFTTFRAYFVVYPTDTISHTLNVLLTALIIAAAVTTALGAAIGRWAARRALAPLRRAAIAASAIASGELDTRIETSDASDLQVLATAFNSMVDALQNRIAREARFTSDVAHELRSPLTTLSTALAVIETRRDELTERSQHALSLLSEEVKRFRTLITDLLEISRVDANVDALSQSLVRVGPLLANALAHAGAGDVPVVISNEVARHWLSVDKRRIERIIANLVENAERYGGGVTNVVAIEADAEHLQICVDDNGPGVPEEERERIFDRFARGAVTAGRRGLGAGSGLGLALVAEHVKLHGGQVWVETAPSGGARFIVELPFAPAELVEEDDDDAFEQPATEISTTGDRP